MTAFNIIKNITKKGNVVLGAGVYAAALSTKNNDRVIKIGNNIEDPWLSYYYDIISKNQKNKHVPKVHYFYMDYDNDYYVCIMEKLYPTEAYDDVTACKEYIEGLLTEEEFITACGIEDTSELLFLVEKIKEGTTAEEETNDMIDISGLNKLDMHTGNVMKRANGDFVITDPWSNFDVEDLVGVEEWACENGLYD